MNFEEKDLKMFANPNCFFNLRLGKRVILVLTSPDKKTAITMELYFKTFNNAEEYENKFWEIKNFPKQDKA